MRSDLACILFTLVIVGMLLMLILVPLSLSHVEYYQYGLKKRRSGSVDSSKVYESGRYLLGPAYDFVKYPADAHFVEIEELAVFSAGDNEDSIGLSFKVDVDFTYLLKKNEIGKLHEELAGSYDTVIQSRARDAIKNEAIFVTFEQYFQERKAVELRFRQAVEKRWKDKPALPCTLDQFHLGRIQIPDSVYQRQLEARVQNERNDRETFLQQAQRERDLTAVETNKINLEKKLVLRSATAEAALIRARAAVEGNSLRVQARINAYKEFLDALGLTSQEDITTFDYIQSLRGRDSLSMHVTYLGEENVVKTATAN